MFVIQWSSFPFTPPMEFGNGDNDPVAVVMAFGATDHEAHVGALAELARTIAEDGFLEKAWNASPRARLLALF